MQRSSLPKRQLGSTKMSHAWSRRHTTRETHKRTASTHQAKQNANTQHGTHAHDEQKIKLHKQPADSIQAYSIQSWPPSPPPSSPSSLSRDIFILMGVAALSLSLLSYARCRCRCIFLLLLLLRWPSRRRSSLSIFLCVGARHELFIQWCSTAGAGAGGDGSDSKLEPTATPAVASVAASGE